MPYINGLWLDPKVLYRSKADLIEQATDQLIEKQWDSPFAWAPIQYFAVGGLIKGDFPSEATVAMEQ